ncbi:LCP family protein [Actinokineospora cianjurensis]|uniref:LytR family transcriptional attenuator n=1 Tax=Actinokineospora cianjurensis TaxID=585224 RepID=A0A421B8F7_9PSEU|nr:LCP family protein [Actinokineospora cianjurensis]RLK60490.1 LytR family transcriptional attenuator [Actinokineospora cianjurensis]
MSDDHDRAPGSSSGGKRRAPEPAEQPRRRRRSMEGAGGVSVSDLVERHSGSRSNLMPIPEADEPDEVPRHQGGRRAAQEPASRHSAAQELAAQELAAHERGAQDLAARGHAADGAEPDVHRNVISSGGRRSAPELPAPEPPPPPRQEPPRAEPPRPESRRSRTATHAVPADILAQSTGQPVERAPRPKRDDDERPTSVADLLGPAASTGKRAKKETFAESASRGRADARRSLPGNPPPPVARHADEPATGRRARQDPVVDEPSPRARPDAALDEATPSESRPSPEPRRGIPDAFRRTRPDSGFAESPEQSGHPRRGRPESALDEQTRSDRHRQPAGEPLRRPSSVPSEPTLSERYSRALPDSSRPDRRLPESALNEPNRSEPVRSALGEPSRSEPQRRGPAHPVGTPDFPLDDRQVGRPFSENRPPSPGRRGPQEPLGRRQPGGRVAEGPLDAPQGTGSHPAPGRPRDLDHPLESPRGTGSHPSPGRRPGPAPTGQHPVPGHDVPGRLPPQHQVPGRTGAHPLPDQDMSGHPATRRPGQEHDAEYDMPGRNGRADTRFAEQDLPGRNGHPDPRRPGHEPDPAGRNGADARFAEHDVPGRNGRADQRRTGQEHAADARYAEREVPGRTSRPDLRRPGLEHDAAERNGHPDPRRPGQDHDAAGRADARFAEQDLPGRNGHPGPRRTGQEYDPAGRNDADGRFTEHEAAGRNGRPDPRRGGQEPDAAGRHPAAGVDARRSENDVPGNGHPDPRRAGFDAAGRNGVHPITGPDIPGSGSRPDPRRSRPEQDATGRNGGPGVDPRNGAHPDPRQPERDLPGRNGVHPDARRQEPDVRTGAHPLPGRTGSHPLPSPDARRTGPEHEARTGVPRTGAHPIPGVDARRPDHDGVIRNGHPDARQPGPGQDLPGRTGAHPIPGPDARRPDHDGVARNGHPDARRPGPDQDLPGRTGAHPIPGPDARHPEHDGPGRTGAHPVPGPDVRQNRAPIQGDQAQRPGFRGGPVDGPHGTGSHPVPGRGEPLEQGRRLDSPHGTGSHPIPGPHGTGSHPIPGPQGTGSHPLPGRGESSGGHPVVDGQPKPRIPNQQPPGQSSMPPAPDGKLTPPSGVSPQELVGLTTEMEPIGEAVQKRRRVDQTLARFSKVHDEMRAEEKAKKSKRIKTPWGSDAAELDDKLDELAAMPAEPTVVVEPVDRGPDADTGGDEDDKPKRGRWSLLAKVFSGSAAVVVFAAAGVGWGIKQWADNSIEQVRALDPGSESIQNAAGQRGDENFLLVGSDSREGADAEEGVGNSSDVPGARSDTVMIAHIPADRSRVVIVSFPRDLEINRPGCEQFDSKAAKYTGHQVEPKKNAKMNTAYQVGGPLCVTKVVQELSGLQITRFVGIDFTGFRGMVDAVDGVNVCVEKPMFDTKLNKWIVKDAGTEVVLRGEQALDFVRARHVRGDPTSDYGRIKRQQRFLSSLLRKAMSGQVLLDPSKLTSFTGEVAKSTFGDNIGVDSLMQLGQSLQNLEAGRVTFITVPTVGTSNSRGNEVLRKDDADRLFRAIINKEPLSGEAPPPPATDNGGTQQQAAPLREPVDPKTLKVQVLNGGNETGGIAKRTAEKLEGFGFTVVQVNPTAAVTRTVVRYGKGHEAAAQTLASTIPSATMQEDPSMSAALVLVIGPEFTGQVVAPGTPGGPTPTPTPKPLPDLSTVNGSDVKCA